MSFKAPFSTKPAPLTFDRVADDVPITSSTLLFRFPIELVSHIVKNLSPTDLCALARVDSDCRQLARSIQFAHVIIDLASPEQGLLDKLDSELLDMTKPSTRKYRRLGPCIRYLEFLPKVDGTCPSPDSNTLQTSVSQLGSLYANALPNLYALKLYLPPQLPQKADTFTKLWTSGAKHVSLNTAWMPIFDYPIQHSTWGLETLYITNSDMFHHQSSTGAVLEALYASRQTLQTFVWKNCGPLVPIPSEAISLILLSLPRLRQLHLEGFYVDGTSPPFVSCRIIDLSLESCDSSVFEFFQKCGSIDCLRSVRVKPIPNADRHAMLGFLENNSHVTSLDVDHGSNDSAPISQLPLLHLLPRHFKDLVALRLVWETATIPTPSLSMLSHISTLETLWISAGPQHGCTSANSEFVVDHDAVLDVAKSLPRLKNLAFTRDTYLAQSHPLVDPSSSPSRYYTQRQLPSNVFPERFLTEEERAKVYAKISSFDFDDARMQWRKIESVAWERWHVSEMVRLGWRYLNKVPTLGYIYVGMVPVYRHNDGLGAIRGLDLDGRLVNETWQDVLSLL